MQRKEVIPNGHIVGDKNWEAAIHYVSHDRELMVSRPALKIICNTIVIVASMAMVTGATSFAVSANQVSITKAVQK
jgi:hypothetical protein